MDNHDDQEALIPDAQSASGEHFPPISGSEDSTASSDNNEGPKDRYFLCHFAFFVIGLCQLLPWNFLLNATNVSFSVII